MYMIVILFTFLQFSQLFVSGESEVYRQQRANGSWSGHHEVRFGDMCRRYQETESRIWLLNMSYFMSQCSLLVIACTLPIIACSLPIIAFPFIVIACTLQVIACTLLVIACYVLFIAFPLVVIAHPFLGVA